MYALFAKVNKKNKITSINLKKVLSSSTNIINFTDLQSKIETDTAHTVTFTEKLVKKNTINKLIDNSMNGLYFIKKIDVETKTYQIVVPSMLFSDYKAYIKAFKKEFRSNKKIHLIKNTRLSKEIHDMLALKKINIQSMINILVTKLLPSSKFPSNYSMRDMKSLERVLKKRGNKGSCIKSYDKYFKIKPDPCKNYFKLDIKTLSTSYARKVKREKRIAKSIPKVPKLKKKSKVKVGSIAKSMGYVPKTRTKAQTMTKTELKMRMKRMEDKRKKKRKRKKSLQNFIKKENRKKRIKRNLKRDEKKRLKKLLKSVKKVAKVKNIPKGIKKLIKKKEKKERRKMRRKMRLEKMDSEFEDFTNKLKINKNDNFAMILFRAIIITVVAVSLLGVINKPLFINLLKILKIPANTIMNLSKFNNQPSQ